MTNYNVLQIVIMVVVVAASVIDMRTTKIPNWLTFGSAVLGIILNFALLHWPSGLWAMGGWVAGVAIMLGFKILCKMGGMGMGDVKLIGAIGAFLGMKVILVWGFFAIFYGAFATYKFATALPWSQVGKMAKAASVGVPSTLDKDAGEKLNAVMNKPIPLAPIIAFGTLAAILLEKPALLFLGFPAP